MKFSVIVPVYNVAPYLRACLDSVLMQTVPDWECVCVDDGSTDGCAGILDEYGARDARFRIVHKANGGVAMARNDGLDVIGGEWFLFLDADDVWAPNLLEVCLRAMAHDPAADMVKFLDRHFAQDSSCVWDCADRDIAFESVDMTGAFDHGLCGFVAPKICFRRERYADLRERPYCLGEDLVYLAQCALRTRRMVRADLRLYGYRDRLSSVTRTTVSVAKARDTVRYLGDIADEVSASGRGMSRSSAKWLANTVTELFYFEKLSCLAEGGEVWGEWRAVLRRMADTGLFGLFQTVRMRLVGRLPGRFAASVLCYFPCYLKHKGIHG